MNKRIEFKNHQREIFHFQLRLVFGIGFVLVLLVILLVRFVYLQAVRHSYYQTLSESNRIAIVPIVPNRGLIRRPQRCGAGAQLFRLHAGDRSEKNRRYRSHDKQPGDAGRNHQQGPQTIQKTARREPQLRNTGDPQPPQR